MQSIAYVKLFLHKHYLLFILWFFLASLTTAGQAQETINPLTIGDKIPDIEFENMINYPTKTARLSNFKSKLTILDFWSSSCSACIGYFPHLQSLKDKFKNELQIVLVNSKTKIYHDNRGKINSVLRRLQDRSDVDIKLPIVFSSQELDNYFPWSTIPQEVWVNNKDIIVAITGPEEVTDANIKAILEGKNVALRTKQYISLDLQKHSLSELVYDTALSLGEPISSCTLIKGVIDGLGSGMGLRYADSPFNKLYTGLYFINMPLLAIYRSAYRDMIKYPPNQVFIETRDSGRFRKVDYRDTSMPSDVYSYDITVPPITFEKLLEYVQNDLERTFHASVINQKRKMECYVVRTTTQSAKSYTKGGNREYRMERIDAKKYVRNYPMSELVRDLNVNYFKIPLVDKTGLTRNVDIEMSHDLSQHNIILALEKAGFEVTKEEKDMDIAMIIDK